MPYPRKHILVTGCPRSGTTFLGTTLALTPSIGYIREPFNFDFGLDGLEHQFVYLYPGMSNQAMYDDIIDDLFTGKAHFKQLSVRNAETTKRKLGRALFKSGSNFSYLKATTDPRVKRLLLKDPMAVFSSEYLATAHHLQVIGIIRHPLPTIASMKRVNLLHNLDELKAQTELYKRYLKEILAHVMLSRLSETEQRALLWLCTNTVLQEQTIQCGDFITVKHEDLSLDPIVNFKKLYHALDITWSSLIEKKLVQITSDSNTGIVTTAKMHVPKRNSREIVEKAHLSLTSVEQKKIRSITNDLVKILYGTTDWPLNTNK